MSLFPVFSDRVSFYGFDIVASVRVPSLLLLIASGICVLVLLLDACAYVIFKAHLEGLV